MCMCVRVVCNNCTKNATFFSYSRIETIMGGRTGDDYMIMPFLIRQTGLFFKISLFFFVVLLGRRYSHLVLVEKKMEHYSNSGVWY